MAKKSLRIPRTTPELLKALDEQMFLLRTNLHSSKEDSAHLRALAVGLRTLVCESTGTEGLLWRLVDELHVSDEIALECGGSADRKHSTTLGISIAKIPLWRPGHGLPGLTPGYYSLREVIKHHEAIFVAAIQDEIYTHERLIQEIAGQMGAHEAEGLDNRVVRLNNFLINQEVVYSPILALDAELTLQVGERVLDHAEQSGQYRRSVRAAEHGDVTLLVRFSLKNHLASRAPVLTFRSHVSEVDIQLAAGPESAAFTLVKRGRCVTNLTSPYPIGWSLHTDAVFAFSYCSNHRLARMIVNDRADNDPAKHDLGWVNAREIELCARHDITRDFVAVQFALPSCKLLSPGQCAELLRMSPDLRELFQATSQSTPFPE